MSDMKTEMRSFVAISDIISLLNMSSGFLSIISSINNNLGLAAILMLVAIMFDSVDGWVARKTNRHDELGFGKNIDSLSDIVSFGVAPAIFIYSCINTTPGILQTAVILISLFIVICGVLRLTRYNVIADKLVAEAKEKYGPVANFLDNPDELLVAFWDNNSSFIINAIDLSDDCRRET